MCVLKKSILFFVLIFCCICGEVPTSPNFKKNLKVSFYSLEKKVDGYFVFDFPDKWKLSYKEQDEKKSTTDKLFFRKEKTGRMLYVNEDKSTGCMNMEEKAVKDSICRDADYLGMEMINNKEHNFAHKWVNCDFDGYLLHYFGKGNNYTVFTSIYDFDEIIMICSNQDDYEKCLKGKSLVFNNGRILGQEEMQKEFRVPSVCEPL